MFIKLLIGWCLMAVCVSIRAAGLASALGWLRSRESAVQPFGSATWLFIRLAGWMVLLHLSEIAVRGLFYLWSGGMPDLHSALYFSCVTYTTTGYGDFVLPKAWRIVGGVEALTGVLMCGWSTGFFFAVVSRMYESRQK
jgi:hypothetical protein